ncbi:hypothetical protein [Pseudomonas sp.]|nr:hypothetical protein [Pseudomonas sp.]
MDNAIASKDALNLILGVSLARVQALPSSDTASQPKYRKRSINPTDF